MGQTLTNGIYLPDEGERNSYSGLEANWRMLDALILTVNGKAAPNVANTWTAAQTFTAGITGDLTGNVTGNVTGDLTGTAAKAIADEDGTSIKTGYGKLAGSQTWSGINTYNDGIYTKTGFRAINDSYSSGTPSANIFYSALAYGGLVSNTFTRSFSIDGAIRTTGYNDLSLRVYSQTGEVLSGVLIESNATASDIAFRPLINGTHKLGSSSYQWSSVYAQSYYYNGTAWGLDKANVWTQTNYFTKDFIINSEIAANTQSALSGSKIRQIIFNDRSNSNYFFRLRQYVDATSSRMQFNAQGFDSNNQAYGATFVYRTNSSGNTELYPGDNNQSLGNSTNKWKTINGVNPGALSLPDTDNKVDITSEFTDLTGGGIFYIPPADGWITITADNEIYCAVVSTTHRTTLWSQSASATSISNASVTIPVKYPQHFLARIKSTNAITVTFYPCLGDV